MIHYQSAVLDRIAEIHRHYPNPQCYLVALFLASEFKGKIYYNSSHCITLINETFYDKTGVVTREEFDLKFLPLDRFGAEIKGKLLDSLIKKHKT